MLYASFRLDSLSTRINTVTSNVWNHLKISKMGKINVYEGCLKIVILGCHGESLGHGNTGYIKHD